MRQPGEGEIDVDVLQTILALGGHVLGGVHGAADSRNGVLDERVVVVARALVLSALALGLRRAVPLLGHHLPRLSEWECRHVARPSAWTTRRSSLSARSVAASARLSSSSADAATGVSATAASRAAWPLDEQVNVRRSVGTAASRRSELTTAPGCAAGGWSVGASGV